MWPHCGQCPHQPQDDASAAFAVRPRACRQTASRGGNGGRDGARRPPAGTACRRYLDRAAARERLDERGEAGHLFTHPAGQDGRRVCPERGDVVDEEALPASIGRWARRRHLRRAGPARLRLRRRHDRLRPVRCIGWRERFDHAVGARGRNRRCWSRGPVSRRSPRVHAASGANTTESGRTEASADSVASEPPRESRSGSLYLPVQ